MTEPVSIIVETRVSEDGTRREYIKGDWPKRTVIAHELLTMLPAITAKEGGEYAISFENGSAVYRLAEDQSIAYGLVLDLCHSSLSAPPELTLHQRG